MPEITIDTRVKLSPDVLFQELQGDAVLLDMKSGVYFGLDHVGTRMWQLMADPKPLSAVVEVVMSEFDVAEDRCTEDVLALARKLAEQGLLSAE